MASAARLLRSARLHAKLSQAELARRSGVARTVINAYEQGTREPGVDALDGILAAAGAELRIGRRPLIDDVRNGRILVQVLNLAEELPTRRRGQLAFPPLHRIDP